MIKKKNLFNKKKEEKKVKEKGTQTADLGTVGEAINWAIQNPSVMIGGLGATNAVIWGKVYSNFLKMKKRNAKTMKRD